MLLSWEVDTLSFFIYTGIMLYDNIIIDSVNLAYKTFGNFSTEPPKKVQSDLVYKKAICSFVHCVEDLKKKYLSAEGHISIFCLTTTFPVQTFRTVSSLLTERN